MCGRYALLDLSEFVSLFPWVLPPVAFAPRYNIAPSQPILALANRDGGVFDHLLWGFIPGWAKVGQGVKPLINARAETVAQKPAFKGSMRHWRCVLPASGFYEWKQTGAGKRPQYITLSGGEPMLFAGLWEESHDGGGGEIRTACIITTAANAFMRTIHDRMPAILRPEEARRWITAESQDADELTELLRPYPGAMRAHAVGMAVNRPGAEGKQCIAPVEEKGLFE